MNRKLIEWLMDHQEIRDQLWKKIKDGIIPSEIQLNFLKKCLDKWVHFRMNRRN